jgi:hypothetical protein
MESVGYVRFIYPHCTQPDKSLSFPNKQFLGFYISPCLTTGIEILHKLRAPGEQRKGNVKVNTKRAELECTMCDYTSIN